MADSDWMSQVKRGLLELCILNLVSREAMYGYQIVKRLASVPSLVITTGTIYPLLSRLKQDGFLISTLVESTQGPARRAYTVTAAGRRHLLVLNQSWHELVASVNTFVPMHHSE